MFTYLQHVCVYSKDIALLEDSKHFTVLIKNDVEFPKFKQKRSVLKSVDYGRDVVVSLSDIEDTVIINVKHFSVLM